MSWTIEYTESAIRVLRKLDKQSARRIVDYMDERVLPLADPRSAGKALSGPLGEFWRYRVGDFRIICAIHNTAMQILVIKIGNRKEIYR